DRELVALARDCLAEEPDSRPRDAGVVAERITAYRTAFQERLRQAELERAAAEAQADSARARVQAERRAHRLLAAMGVTAVLLLSAMAGGTWWWQQRRQLTVTHVESLLDQAGSLAAQAEQKLSERHEGRLPAIASEQALDRYREAAATVARAGEVLETAV